MGKLTTHVLDTMNGTPAEGVRLTIYRLNGVDRERIATNITNADGRTNAPLLEGEALSAGYFEIEFEIGDYFHGRVNLPKLTFLNTVPIRFGIEDENANYHVPLLASPYGYSTYRGS